MAAAAQLPFVPLEVYLRSSYEPDAEYVDGVIEERSVGQYDHSSWQHALEMWFAQHAKEWDIRVRPELRIRVRKTNFRIPDVTVLDRSLPVEQVVTRPPIAVFEVLSPEDSVTRMMTKLADYEQMGIQTILVLDPDGKHFRFRAGALEPLTETAFDLPGSKCRFDLAEIIKLLD
ncbi:Uma2 family endonuclease [Terracidiphilus gabretensis]|jgi:Uma2 family endonuclease|uniref:Uma2 family endonuclease n=1 Tax=Terracidiphilus gabretensis TaxID=1577687 RepID=UPI00071B8225|nr:Uma2 family endonuclease [Terracidiphilus gabretensis]